MNKPAIQDMKALLQRIEELERDNRDLRAMLSDRDALSKAEAAGHDAQDRRHAQEISSATAHIGMLEDSRVSLQASEKRLRESETRARASEKKLKQIADNIPALIAYVDADQCYRFNNQAYASWFGRPPESLYGVHLHDAVGTTAYERVRPYIEAVLRGERTGHEWWMQLPNDLKFVRSEYIPDKRDDGSIAGFYVLAADLSESKRSQAALAESEARLRLAIDAAQMAVWEMDIAADKIHFSPEMNRLLGFAPGETPSSDEIRSRYAPGQREKLRRIAAEALARGHCHAETELEVVLPDGKRRWLLVRAEMKDIENGSPARAVGVALDITDRKQAEEHQQLLINELNHRVKNTLSTVQSIATQSLRNAKTAEAAREAVEGRLFALSRAHDVLTRESWDGAFLREVVQQAIEPFQSRGGERFRVSGPDIRLPPRIALAIAMAIQELGTNAVKYGALSNATGCIAITWSILNESGPHLRMTWEEAEGPKVSVPTKRGFGTRLIERSLAQELNGSVGIDFAPAGVVCTVNAPLAEA